jgi:nicotinamide riboside kinase
MSRPFIVTIFGAESVGKTTLSSQLADKLGGVWSLEFARPYLETTGEDVTSQSMRAIWRGQAKLQRASRRRPARYIVQDTDLFSTVGYWHLPHVEPVIGRCPRSLEHDAIALQSDLYLVLQSNIPFEQNPLRYGGDHRESSDQYWIDLCIHYQLPYIVIEASDPMARINEALQHITERTSLCVA